MLLILLIAISSLPASAKSNTSKSHVLEQLHTTCLKSSFTEGKSQDGACDCLRANYEKKFSVAELELLARIQQGSASKEEIADQDELFEFDMLASQNCLENSAWRWMPEKEEKVKAKTSEAPTKAKAKASKIPSKTKRKN